MSKHAALLFKQLLWLIAAGLVSILIIAFSIKWKFSEPSVYIHLFDTYFVIDPILISLPVFLLLSFALFMAKEFRYGFSRSTPNCIILLVGTALIMLPAFYRLYIPPAGYGRTLYPPLSALDNNWDEDPVATAYWIVVIIVQLLIILSLVHVAFHWGKNKNRQRE